MPEMVYGMFVAGQTMSFAIPQTIIISGTCEYEEYCMRTAKRINTNAVLWLSSD